MESKVTHLGENELFSIFSLDDRTHNMNIVVYVTALRDIIIVIVLLSLSMFDSASSLGLRHTQGHMYP